MTIRHPVRLAVVVVIVLVAIVANALIIRGVVYRGWPCWTLGNAAVACWLLKG